MRVSYHKTSSIAYGSLWAKPPCNRKPPPYADLLLLIRDPIDSWFNAISLCSSCLKKNMDATPLTELSSWCGSSNTSSKSWAKESFVLTASSSDAELNQQKMQHVLFIFCHIISDCESVKSFMNPPVASRRSWWCSEGWLSWGKSSWHERTSSNCNNIRLRVCQIFHYPAVASRRSWWCSEGWLSWGKSSRHERTSPNCNHQVIMERKERQQTKWQTLDAMTKLCNPRTPAKASSNSNDNNNYYNLQYNICIIYFVNTILY